MNTAWWKLLAVGISTAALAVGCVVSDGDGDEDGGTGGTGGSTGGTAGTGGTGGGTGGTDAGTGGATGGTGGTVAVTCDADDPTNSCQVCVEQKCCTEFEACYAGNDACGNPAGNGQIDCLIDCLETGDITSCSGTCGGANITDATNDLYACLDNECQVECLP